MGTFGQRFRELRNEKGLTQEELRQEFNVKFHFNFTLPAISQYENDKRIPEIDALIAFSKYFNVSVDFLLGNSDIRNITEKEVELMKRIEKLDIQSLNMAESIKRLGIPFDALEQMIKVFEGLKRKE